MPDNGPPRTFPDFELTVTVSFLIKGGVYDVSDFDGEDAFRAWVRKEAREGMRHAEFDISDSWIEAESPPIKDAP